MRTTSSSYQNAIALQQALLFLLFFLCMPLLLRAQTIHYVKQGASGTGTGGWANASGDLQAVIGSLSDGDQVWIAAGSYKPGLNQFFELTASNVGIYGGFNGTETQLTQRNPTTNSSVLEGNGNRVFACRYYSFGTDQTVIDGLSFQNGNDPVTDYSVAGGGGMYIEAYTNPAIRNCKFLNNISLHSTNQGGAGGGAIVNPGAKPVFTNCLFAGNTSYQGGGLYVSGADPVLINCLFSGNKAIYRGGGMACYGNFGTYPVIRANPTIINCTFAGNNAASTGGALYNIEADILLTNSIVWGNSSGMSNAFNQTTLTDINNLVSGAGGTDPLFVSPLDYNNAPATGGNYQLQSNSPAINGGDNGAYTGPGYDLANAQRITGTVIDMGAFEWDGTLPALFGAITATIDRQQLIVNWETYSESDNSHFNIEASSDGIHFVTLKRVASLAPEAGSGSRYTATLKLADVTLEMGIPALLLVSVLFISSIFAKYTRALMVMLILGVILLYGCTKEDTTVEPQYNRPLSIRIAQVDKDGTVRYSKVVRAVLK